MNLRSMHRRSRLNPSMKQRSLAETRPPYPVLTTVSYSVMRKFPNCRTLLYTAKPKLGRFQVRDITRLRQQDQVWYWIFYMSELVFQTLVFQTLDLLNYDRKETFFLSVETLIWLRTWFLWRRMTSESVCIRNFFFTCFPVPR